MKNLFDPVNAAEIQDRLTYLQPDSPRQWGLMNPAQAVVHCSWAAEIALGDRVPLKGTFLGRTAGLIIKPLILRDDKPMRPNAPTPKDLVVTGNPDFEIELQRLKLLIDRFHHSNSTGITRYAHTFFGPLKPHEWAILGYKHLDHHLRQFSV